MPSSSPSCSARVPAVRTPWTSRTTCSSSTTGQVGWRRSPRAGRRHRVRRRPTGPPRLRHHRRCQRPLPAARAGDPHRRPPARRGGLRGRSQPPHRGRGAECCGRGGHDSSARGRSRGGPRLPRPCGGLAGALGELCVARSVAGAARRSLGWAPMSPRVLRALDAEPGDLDEWMSALAGALGGSGPALLPLPAGPAGVRSALLEALRPDDPSAPLESDDVALVVPTSGSTGVPKGALLSAAALRGSAAATHARLGGAGSWVLALPLTHVAGLMVLVRAIEGGGTVSRVALSEGFDAAGFDAVTAAAAGAARLEGQPLYTSLVPTQLARLLDAGVDLSPYSAILLGAAAAPDQLLARAR